MMLQQTATLAGDLPIGVFGRFFVDHERMLWKLSDVAWDQIDSSALDAPTLAAVRGALLVESHNPVYASTLLDRFRHDFPMTNFLAVWTYEEFKHFAGLKAYLEAAEAMAPELLEAELATTRAGEWLIPDRYTDLMMATYAMLQELITGIFYKNFALQVREPVLRLLLGQIGKDEYRHCQFYFDYAKRVLEADRSRLDEVDTAMLEFEMPGPGFVPDYDDHAAAMLAAANPGAGAFREVLTKVSNLIGKRHMLRLAGNATYRQRLQQMWGIEPRHLFAFS
jgi:acyl-[acyl-carrier-protein] desaturase